MQNYRLYFLDGPYGHIEAFEPIIASSDAAAMEAASRFRGPHHLELYLRARKVGDIKSAQRAEPPIEEAKAGLDIRP